MLPPAWQPHSIPGRPVRLSLLCESQTGYRNLSLFISSYKLAQQTKGDGIAPFRKVEEYAGGWSA
jgi:error-prone DNA polymerase